MGRASQPAVSGATARVSVFERQVTAGPVATGSAPRHDVSIPSLPEEFMNTANGRTVLLVIDVQESFRKRPYWQPDEAAAFLANTQALIDRSRQEGIPV